MVKKKNWFYTMENRLFLAQLSIQMGCNGEITHEVLKRAIESKPENAEAFRAYQEYLDQIVK